MTGERGPADIPNEGAFESYVRVRFHELDALGHVNNSSYLNYLEQAAIDHATYLGLDNARLEELGGVFLARRHDIVFIRPALAGDVLRVVTWLGATRGARIERNYRIVREAASRREIPTAGRLLQNLVEDPDDELIVRAVTEWVFANNQGSPRRIPGEILNLLGLGVIHLSTEGR